MVSYVTRASIGTFYIIIIPTETMDKSCNRQIMHLGQHDLIILVRTKINTSRNKNHFWNANVLNFGPVFKVCNSPELIALIIDEKLVKIHSNDLRRLPENRKV